MTAVDRQARIRRVSEGVVASYLHEIARSTGSGLLARDLAGRLVEAQAEEGGMAQAAVGGPLHERDLRHELGLDPRRGARDALLRLERGRVAHERSQPLGEITQR